MVQTNRKLPQYLPPSKCIANAHTCRVISGDLVCVFSVHDFVAGGSFNSPSHQRKWGLCVEQFDIVCIPMSLSCDSEKVEFPYFPLFNDHTVLLRLQSDIIKT